MKIVKYLKEAGLLIKSANETIKDEAKEQKVSFLGVLLGKRVKEFEKNNKIILKYF